MSDSKLRVVPCLKDNYSYVLRERNETECIVVDACEFDPIHKALREDNLDPQVLLLTHSHHDHIGGLDMLKATYPKLKVYAHTSLLPALNAVDFGVEDFQSFELKSFEIQSIHTPCHTMADVSFYLKLKHSSEAGFLFSGDTLFIAGCGRFFEGDGDDMWSSLKKIKTLPLDTQVYCGHEYTKSNLNFAASLEPQNQAIARQIENIDRLIDQGKPTVPSSLKTELETNPFLRWDQKELLEKNPMLVGQTGGEILSTLREMKNNF